MKKKIIFIIIPILLIGSLVFFFYFQRANDFECGESLTYNGDEYATVQIGEQCWFAENLKNTKDVKNNSVERYCYKDEENNCEIYGGLYSWNEIMRGERINGNQGICPNDWHIPSDEEWKQLEAALGMSENELNLTGWRLGGEVGKKLKDEGIYPEGFWLEPNIADNSSGFSARGGGCRNLDGTYEFLNELGGWWTSTSYENDYAWIRFLSFRNVGIDYPTDYKESGLSVRCLKNT